MQDQPSVSCLETLEYCAPDTRYDLTGSVIRASGKLAVYMGDVCAFVPKTVRLAITWRRARFRARPGQARAGRGRIPLFTGPSVLEVHEVLTSTDLEL